MRRTLIRLLIALNVCGPAVARCEDLQLHAQALLERSVTRDVRLSDEGKTVELDRGELLEDDGPSAGYSYLPNEERLSDRLWIKKELIVANPAARKATLLVAPGGDIKASINGKPVELKLAGKAGKYWQAYSIPPEILIKGKNEIVLGGPGSVWIARAEDFAAGSTERPTHPNRSARSTDRGRSWNYDALGPSGEIDGEYYVRLFLDQFRRTGSLTLDVMDAGNLAGRDIAAPLTRPVPIQVHLDAEGERVQLSIRSGTTAIPDRNHWSDWQTLESGDSLENPQGRFLQLAVHLSTNDPLCTPRVKGLRVQASRPKSDDWTARLKVLECDNAAIVRSSIPFTYEPMDSPRLKELRKLHRLDEVAKGSATELELVEHLARWSASRWKHGHLSEAYPPWNALEILKPHADGTPVGGFCQQYNLVFLQACESFGIPGRAVSIGVGDHGGKIEGSGHEVVELWTNQFHKWIYVDGNMAWYAVDAESGVPLSLLELRGRQLCMLNGKPVDPTRIVHLRKEGKRWEGLDQWPAFLELRLVPRSDFIERNSPLPLNQGMRGWFWTGHHVWTDAEYPASVLYGNRVSHPHNWSWTLNQAHFTLEATPTAGELRVHLDTQTPGFDTFLAGIDNSRLKPVSADFIWKLHDGTNSLKVLPRNLAGREGIPSSVSIGIE